MQACGYLLGIYNKTDLADDLYSRYWVVTAGCCRPSAIEEALESRATACHNQHHDVMCGCHQLSRWVANEVAQDLPACDAAVPATPRHAASALF